MPALRTEVAIIGGGPAGLMAAERLLAAGHQVTLFEAKGSPGRKFLIAGKGGLNLTHADTRPLFDSRYRERAQAVGQWLDVFDGPALRQWASSFGIDTYIGSSGRVFPEDRKAAPLLRGWVRRLKEQGLALRVNHRWTGFDPAGQLLFDTPEGTLQASARAVILATGGASWPELGSDGQWVAPLREQGIAVAELEPANCGFDVDWSEHFIQRQAGAPIKPVIAHWRDGHDQEHQLQGECVVSQAGIEGSLVYAIGADLRQAINRDGHAVLALDLVPGRDLQRLRTDLASPRKGRSFSEHLRRQAGIGGVKAALLYEILGRSAGDDLDAVAHTLKRLPLTLRAPRPIAEAISSAGGVRLEELDPALMLNKRPGVFCAGEMLDWEAPTGGYLLTACFASGAVAAAGASHWLQQAP
ncbi:NAD(FAD)-utilizing dehydrogenase [Stenotrophomonas ginsengisoli]|uniref:NAD(FAD)-utilizing dehydrogenase n=1 Tax=Stenotrophomonas ginsengisoli TaxID=336566 RepID=A0A0R0D7E3_9GAMM|nr:TIGR03862 family flavoprotein [Stenotrophomonas ginsengisoli]KRG77573.1 NAD(FAD)-utilizing dehydrogenase [Stenotrophomonas ginsengisoli]